ncbi:MAG: RNA recognition motif domain-containing protein [Sulfobacillus sp.]|jgi:RNA recognition motif-containing protein
MPRTLYVGNLPWTTTEEELTELFAATSTVVSCRIIVDRESNRSRGFGFVEISDESNVETVVEAMNGASVGGRTLVVNEARPRTAGL